MYSASALRAPGNELNQEIQKQVVFGLRASCPARLYGFREDGPAANRIADSEWLQTTSRVPITNIGESNGKDGGNEMETTIFECIQNLFYRVYSIF